MHGLIVVEIHYTLFRYSGSERWYNNGAVLTNLRVERPCRDVFLIAVFLHQFVSSRDIFGNLQYHRERLSTVDVARKVWTLEEVIGCQDNCPYPRILRPIG